MLLRAAGADGELRGFELQGAARALAVAAVHDELRHLGIGVRGVADALPGVVGSEPGGGDVRLAVLQLRLDCLHIGDRGHDERDAELLGKGARELELQAFGAVGAEIIGSGGVERDDPQLAARADFIERAGLRRAGADKKE